MHHCFMISWLTYIKKNITKFLKVKTKRLKYDYKNPKDLDYQPDQRKMPDQLKLTKWVKATKSRVNKIQSIITEDKKSGLSTIIDNEKITVVHAEILVKDIVSKKINRKEAKNVCNTTADKANKTNTSRNTKSRKEL